jgi:tetratricopeptide (TPR) repeat protein
VSPPPPSHGPPTRRASPRGQTDRTGRVVLPDPSDGRDPAFPALRLAIGPAGLGLELAEPLPLACLRVTELSIAIPGVRFPLDVSGGVSRFRHKRGRLQRVSVELSTRGLEAFVAPRLRGMLGIERPAIWLSVRAAGATVALVDMGAEAPRILAFEVAVEAHGDDVRLMVHGARGTGLSAPAAALALHAVHAVLGKGAARDGASFRLSAVAQSIARAILPDAGVRAPDASGVRWTGLGAQGDTWLFFADGAGARPDVTEEAARASEAIAITGPADDALFAGDFDGARALAVAALERAPKHREVCRRIADIDRLAGGRVEAALATMVEAERHVPGGPAGVPVDQDGLLVGELLAEVGDVDAAVATLVRAGETEPVVALAARSYERAAELTADPEDALVWLDLAIARAPAIARVRWSRLARRLAAGRVEDALADAEHLEAQARGTLARHEVWKRAGEAWGSAGRAAEAAALYERALRFEPTDAGALAGLGRALLASHRAPRGTSLLARAVDVAQARGDAAPGLVLELAIALAEAMDDRPAAIARVGSVGSESAEAARARGLEGRWRAQLGDVAGASFAFARLRELADARVSDGSSVLAALLVEAAMFEREIREDLLAAQRHLAVALRLEPKNSAARNAYRDVGFRIAGRPAESRHEDARRTERPPPAEVLDIAFASQEEERALEPARAPERARTQALAPGLDLETGGDADDTARAEELIRKLHADPGDDRVADELADRLLRLGRSHELLALLSARVEDAGPERRAALLPRQREVLARLIRDARAAGRAEEAALFEDALEMLS